MPGDELEYAELWYNVYVKPMEGGTGQLLGVYERLHHAMVKIRAVENGTDEHTNYIPAIGDGLFLSARITDRDKKHWKEDVSCMAVFDGDNWK